MNNTPTVSYAQIIQKISFPTKEQAIIIDSVDGVTIHDYTVAIGRLIGPNNIRFASRISQGRVCLYLSSKEIADKLTDDHSHFPGLFPHSKLSQTIVYQPGRHKQGSTVFVLFLRRHSLLDLFIHGETDVLPV